MRRAGRWTALVVLPLALSACGDVDFRATLADIVTAEKNGRVIPAAPSGLSALSTSSVTIHLSWTDNSNNETGFKIERSTDDSAGWSEVQLTAVNAASWDDSGLSAGYTYSYRVKATNGAGDSDCCVAASAMTAQIVPTAPSELAVSGASTTSIHLSWTDNSANEARFRIERSPDGFTGWVFIKDVPADTTGWDDTGLPVGTGYSYRVHAANSAGDSDATSAAHTSTFFTSMVAINAAGDSFTMGDGSTYGPNPPVTQYISYNYSVSKHEITNTEFETFLDDGGYTNPDYWTTHGLSWKGTKTAPYYWTDSRYNGPNQPIVGVSWYEAVAFCNWRSIKEGLTPAYSSDGRVSLSASGYHLPTEVEWEYAAAKGASGQSERVYPWVGAWNASYVVCGTDRTANVGSKSPYGDTLQEASDMGGNAWEWCSDNYQLNASVPADSTNRYYFVDDISATHFIFRGGSFIQGDEYYFRCVYRDINHTAANTMDYSIGFRVVRQ